MSDAPPDFEGANPFDLLGLDPRMTPRELTEVLRQRAERALPEERAQLQGLWRKLTLKESERIKYALLAHPRGSRQGAQKLDALREAGCERVFTEKASIFVRQQDTSA